MNRKYFYWFLLISLAIHSFFISIKTSNLESKKSQSNKIIFQIEDLPKEKELSSFEKELNDLQNELDMMSANKTSKASNKDKGIKKSAEELKKYTSQKIVKENTDKSLEEISQKERSRLSGKQNLEKSKKWIGKNNNKDKSYTGKSFVEYLVHGRIGEYIANPIYTCDYPSIIYLIIWVNEYGKITEIEIDKSKSYEPTACAIETAKNYALKSRFSISKNSSKGYIKYTFR